MTTITENNMNIFNKISLRIIKEQESIIGPLAWYEAKKVNGFSVLNENKGEVSFQDGDPKIIIDKLVNQYEKIFGKASHEVCRDAVRDIVVGMSPEEVPSSLK